MKRNVMSKLEMAVAENRQAIECLKAQVAYKRAGNKLDTFVKAHAKEIEVLERSRDRGYDEVRERALIRLEEIRVQEIELLRDIRLCGRNLMKVKEKSVQGRKQNLN